MLHNNIVVTWYLITRELGWDKLRIEWGIKARRYEKKVNRMKDDKWIKKCSKKKNGKNGGIYMEKRVIIIGTGGELMQRN